MKILERMLVIAKLVEDKAPHQGVAGFLQRRGWDHSYFARIGTRWNKPALNDGWYPEVDALAMEFKLILENEHQANKGGR